MCWISDNFLFYGKYEFLYLHRFCNRDISIPRPIITHDSTRHARIYVKSPYDPPQPPEDGQTDSDHGNTCQTRDNTCCKEQTDCKEEDTYEAYDYDVPPTKYRESSSKDNYDAPPTRCSESSSQDNYDAPPTRCRESTSQVDYDVPPTSRESLSQVDYHAVSNELYEQVNGNDNEAFDSDEDQAVVKSYDWVEPTASIRLPPRIIQDESEVTGNEDNAYSLARSLPESTGKDNVEANRESASDDELGSGMTERKYSDNLENDENVYDVDLAKVVFQRQSGSQGKSEKTEEEDPELYKEMVSPNASVRVPYEHMEIGNAPEDVYKVIDPHISIKRK